MTQSIEIFPSSSRRGVIRAICCGACHAIALGLASNVHAKSETGQGCIRIGSDTQLDARSGSADLDRALNIAIRKLGIKFDVNPKFGFYADSDRPDSFVVFPTVAGSDGTVALGQALFRNVMGYDPSGVSLLVVLAHKFGHIAQYKSNRLIDIWGNASTARRVELHADFLSGYYLGYSMRHNSNGSFAKAGNRYLNINFFDPREPTNFGLPKERAEAFERGFNVGALDGDMQLAMRAAEEFISSR